MKLKIKQPTSLKDIKLSQYQEFLKEKGDSEDVEFIARLMVSIFCNIKLEYVGKINVTHFNEIVSDLLDILDEDKIFKSNIEHHSIVKYEGVKYGFVHLEDITLAEQADIDKLIVEWKDMHRVMSILYRPITSNYKGNYLIEEYDGNPKGLDLTLDVVFGALVFFYNLLNDLHNYIQSTINQGVVQSPKIKEILEENGDGINPFMLSLREIFSNLKELVSCDYMKHYYSFPLNQKRTS